MSMNWMNSIIEYNIFLRKAVSERPPFWEYVRARRLSIRSSVCQHVIPGGGSLLSIWSSRFRREALCISAWTGMALYRVYVLTRRTVYMWVSLTQSDAKYFSVSSLVEKSKRLDLNDAAIHRVSVRSSNYHATCLVNSENRRLLFTF